MKGLVSGFLRSLVRGNDFHSENLRSIINIVGELVVMEYSNHMCFGLFQCCVWFIGISYMKIWSSIYFLTKIYQNSAWWRVRYWETWMHFVQRPSYKWIQFLNWILEGLLNIHYPLLLSLQLIHNVFELKISIASEWMKVRGSKI